MSTPNHKTALRDLRRTNRKMGPKSKQEVWLAGYSDASYKLVEDVHQGGWGVWVRDGETRVLRSGPCPDWITKSQDAELCGVWAAIYTALTELDTETANIMVIKTDCQNVAKFYGWGSGNFPTDDNSFRLVCKSFEMAHEKGIRLVVTWVKGHQGTRTTKGYLNGRVDSMAKTARLTGKKAKRRYLVKQDRQEAPQERLSN